jgi:LPS-assembly lipoprotein
MLKPPLIAVYALLMVSLTFGGCGFKPIYAQSAGLREQLSEIYISAPASSMGYEIRQALINDFGASRATESSPYQLSINLRSVRAGYALRVDDVATRREILVQASYLLEDVQSNRVLSRGSVEARSFYDAPEDPYSEVAAEQSARDRAARSAAADIHRAIQFDLFGRSSTS